MQKICDILKKSWTNFFLVKTFLFAGLLISNDVKSQHTIYLTSDWTQFGAKCAGCNSAYFLIHRNGYPNNNGLYYSTIYVYSNSFNTRGSLGVTRINYINIYAVYPNGLKKGGPLISAPYYLARPPQEGYFNGWNVLGYVWSPNPAEQYIVEFSSLEIY